MSNITENFMNYPYNLSKLENISGISEFFVKANTVEFMGNSIGTYFPIYVIFLIIGIVSYTTAYLRGYDTQSNLLFSTTLLFFIGLIGKLVVIDGIVMIPTYFVIFLGVLMSISLGWRLFS